jgi:hypothetical protein
MVAECNIGLITRELISSVMLSAVFPNQHSTEIMEQIRKDAKIPQKILNILRNIAGIVVRQVTVLE